jgi:hypothetical protein
VISTTGLGECHTLPFDEFRTLANEAAAVERSPCRCSSA